VGEEGGMGGGHACVLMQGMHVCGERGGGEGPKPRQVIVRRRLPHNALSNGAAPSLVTQIRHAA
jgi:hypothetical protein